MYQLSGDLSGFQFGMTKKAVDEAFRTAGIPTMLHVEHATIDPLGVFYYRPFDKVRDANGALAQWQVLHQESHDLYFEWRKTSKAAVERITIAHHAALTPLIGAQEASRRQLEYWEKQGPQEFNDYVKEKVADLLNAGNIEIANIVLTENELVQFKQYLTLANPANLMKELDAARIEWQKESMNLPVGEAGSLLLKSPTYMRLRTVAARQGFAMRFVPINEVPLEPQCAGVGYSR